MGIAATQTKHVKRLSTPCENLWNISCWETYLWLFPACSEIHSLAHLIAQKNYIKPNYFFLLKSFIGTHINKALGSNFPSHSLLWQNVLTWSVWKGSDQHKVRNTVYCMPKNLKAVFRVRSGPFLLGRDTLRNNVKIACKKSPQDILIAWAGLVTTLTLVVFPDG